MKLYQKMRTKKPPKTTSTHPKINLLLLYVYQTQTSSKNKKKILSLKKPIENYFQKIYQAKKTLKYLTLLEYQELSL
jgi:hypothetical protein